MSRAARLLALLEALRRRRRPVRGQDLADELGISLRSLYRDIATLQSQGAPIEGEAGLGYVLRPGYLLPPLTFTADEVEALALGARLVARDADSDLVAAAVNALAKIAAVMPEGRRDEFAAVPLLAGPDAVTDEDRFDGTLREAIRAEQKVAIAYRDGENHPTDRLIWPFAIGYFRTALVVAAWCELRADYRHFRLDRIDVVTPTTTRYPRRRHALFDEWRTREGVELTETRMPAARN